MYHSIFSRYGIHSLPSILIVNQTSRVQYRGPKDLPSIEQFYEKITGNCSLMPTISMFVFSGFEPFQYVAGHELFTSGDHNNHMKQSWNEPFSMEIVKREPYLVFSVLFLCMKLLLSIFPIVLSRLETFWVSYAPHLNLEIFGETNQLFARALHMVDVRRVWTKLRLCKTRNFHQGAESARVWASSLASVSLGKSSSGRSSSSP
ncbi:hypothetical protein Golob_018565 [Gossypium lobatum]|uniref:Thioredoxin domain-containing protein n=1 Tax=Gossypium lobatum TaxID=34289 RepID=A0A7J8MAQ0_9ROSI|nr:hypothetical protein [Gossypium lobatum]